MFKGRGLLVSYKALEDWSANQPGETVRMHGDDDNDEDEVETCQRIGTTGQSGEKQTSNEGSQVAVVLQLFIWVYCNIAVDTRSWQSHQWQKG